MKSPAFQFYPGDWLDYKVLRMSYEAQGVYIRLLCHIWRDTKTQYSIHNDPDMLARILGLKKTKFSKIFSEIQWPGDPIFLENGDSIVSARLKKEKEKQEDIRQKRRAAANARYSKCNANAEQMECPSSSTSVRTNISSTSIEGHITKKAPDLPSQEELTEASEKKIREYIDQISENLYRQGIFPEAHKFKNSMLKKHQNPRAVLHALSRCYMVRPEEPWAYCQKIMKVEDGNYNERDYRKSKGRDPTKA